MTTATNRHPPAAKSLHGLRIREAGLSDVEAMVGLLRALFALEPDFTFNEAKQRRGLVQLLCQAEGKCALVAEAGGRVIGMCTVQRVISTAEGAAVGWVEDVVVDAEYRGQGVGKWLLMTLEQWATAQGLKRLQLLADRENRAALEFYKAQGWNTVRMVPLRKRLG